MRIGADAPGWQLPPERHPADMFRSTLAAIGYLISLLPYRWARRCRRPAGFPSLIIIQLTPFDKGSSLAIRFSSLLLIMVFVRTFPTDFGSEFQGQFHRLVLDKGLNHVYIGLQMSADIY